MTAPYSTPRIRKQALSQGLLLCIVMPLCLAAAQPFLDTLDWRAVQSAWRGISVQQWGVAFVATVLSFAALGRYDVIVHRVLGTCVPDTAAQASGAAAVALSQMLGLGLVTGTVARWRALPTLSLGQAGAVTALVSFSFLGAWLALFALSGLAAPGALPLPALVFQACLFSAICFALYTILGRYITIAGLRLRLPSVAALAALVCFAALDTICAALALWALLPSDVEIPVLALYSIYLGCLGIALLSNAPGGVGPFEVTLLWALKDVDANAGLATLLAFRALYFALPACLAAVYLLRPAFYTSPQIPPYRFGGPLHPETPSALQTGSILTTRDGAQVGALGRTSQCAALLFEPGEAFDKAYDALQGAARTNAVIPLLYKIGPRNASHARRRGLAVLRIARDAVIELGALDLTRPAYRKLRRKLKAAQRSGVDIRPMPINAASLEAAAQVDANWQAQSGAARGFSMGRFCPAYLSEQYVLGAWDGDRLCAFLSVHRAQDAWALDLMRADGACPDGVMHALVWRAILDAQAAGCGRFSLASAPCTETPLMRMIARCHPLRRITAPGLVQFKSCFAPRWLPLYAAAPNWPALFLALWDVWQEVRDPPPLKGASRERAAHSSLSL